jgi:hypothetical protein
LPITDLLPLPRLVLSDPDADRFRHGSRVTVPAAELPAAGDERRRAIIDASGQLVGIGSLIGAELQPEKVLAAPGAP